MSDQPLRALSLFSGCGGLDLGIRRAGFEIVLAEDLDPWCAASHRVNFPGVPFHEGSVTDLSGDLAHDLAGDAIDDLDLVLGGPPCPPFSKSRFYRTEKPRALEDPVGWETISGYMNVVARFRPRAFLMENVAGLAYAVHGDAMHLITDRAHELGYRTDWSVLNAADFGVPQIRERLFVVGWRDGEWHWPDRTHQKPSDQPSLRLLQPWATAGEAIGDIDTEEMAGDEGHFAGGQYHHLLEQIPPGDNYLFHTAHRGHPNPSFEWRKRYWSFLLKLSPTMPSWTIQARRSNNMGPFHWRNRILRISEIKRIQTFPDDWYLSGNVERQWRQVGNAVPPVLAEHLGRALRKMLEASPEGPTATDVEVSLHA